MLVMSALAPEAAAPRLVRAPAAVVEPVPPLATVKALVSVRPAKVGLLAVLRFWSRVTLLVTVTVLTAVPPATVKPPALAVRVRPLKLAAAGGTADGETAGSNVI